MVRLSGSAFGVRPLAGLGACFREILGAAHFVSPIVHSRPSLGCASSDVIKSCLCQRLSVGCVLHGWWRARSLRRLAPPNIVLITVDTTRADRMGFLGSERGLTPNLDALARQSVVFTRAYSQVPLTAPSHATILTGTYPQFHQVNNFGVPLATTLPYAPAILHAHGYHTAAFVGALVLDPVARSVPGFDRGFDTYDAGFSVMPPGGDRYHTAERRGGVVVAHAMAWLKQAPARSFLYMGAPVRSA